MSQGTDRLLVIAVSRPVPVGLLPSQDRWRLISEVRALREATEEEVAPNPGSERGTSRLPAGDWDPDNAQWLRVQNLSLDRRV
jgi:hypothetical protein